MDGQMSENVEDMIEELTKFLIKQDLKDKANKTTEILVISRAEAIKRSIKLLKMIKK